VDAAETDIAVRRMLREDEAAERREIIERRRMDRRRQIDPTTCERDYSDQEIEFMRAMDDYKRKSGRPFPTWSEVLEVLRSLGYRKVADPSLMEWKTLGDTTMSL
jgi:FMN phosphatase YigB (HAD superfamily)